MYKRNKCSSMHLLSTRQGAYGNCRKYFQASLYTCLPVSPCHQLSNNYSCKAMSGSLNIALQLRTLTHAHSALHHSNTLCEYKVEIFPIKIVKMSFDYHTHLHNKTFSYHQLIIIKYYKLECHNAPLLWNMTIIISDFSFLKKKKKRQNKYNKLKTLEVQSI